MSKLKDYLMKEIEQAYLIDDEGRKSKTKIDYIKNADQGLIVAFRLNFESKSGVKLTKVISGKILENNAEKEQYVVETRNGLKYGVPYGSVTWVKTGERWPKGVYEELKQGSTKREESDESEYGTELGEVSDGNFESQTDSEVQE